MWFTTDPSHAIMLAKWAGISEDRVVDLVVQGISACAIRRAEGGDAFLTIEEVEALEAGARASENAIEMGDCWIWGRGVLRAEMAFRVEDGFLRFSVECMEDYLETHVHAEQARQLHGWLSDWLCAYDKTEKAK